MTEYIVYRNRKNNRYGYATKEYAYNSDTFLNKRTVLLYTSFEIAEKIVEEMNNEIKN